MRSAEKDLDMFLATVGQHFVKHTGKKLNDGIENVISDRDLARTPVFREPKQVAALKEK